MNNLIGTGMPIAARDVSKSFSGFLSRCEDAMVSPSRDDDSREIIVSAYCITETIRGLLKGR